ncbi:uncharacterized protein LOC116806052 [Drosophila grimshawi]|uniref:uncharacterized protein LOC116806052 n=1 Tax=Drosophila grimshawi TaxID=7222 RepID=UPI000C87153F|nr:uncharacterized protein LOC116806052 [Drosophila grimshawi]
MFSMSRVLRHSIKCILGMYYLPKANRVDFSHLQRKAQRCNIFKNQATFQSSKLLTRYRSMGTLIVIRLDSTKFYIEIDGKVAALKYNIVDGVMEITSTRVPKKLAGHGLGKLLAKEALHFAVQHDLLLKISCKFVRYYINEYEPRYLKYVLY